MHRGSQGPPFTDVVVRSVVATVPIIVDAEMGEQGGEWLVKWFGQFGFVEKGRLSRVGYKLGKWCVWFAEWFIELLT